MRESLRPVNPLTRIDATVKRLLNNIYQDSGELVPISHDTVRPPFTDAHHINTTRTELYNKLKERISDKIDRHLTTTDESEALPLPILQRIIESATNMHITNPIFLGQSIVKVVKKHSTTRNVWKTWQAKYTKDGDLQPVHFSIFTRKLAKPGAPPTKYDTGWPWKQSFRHRSSLAKLPRTTSTPISKIWKIWQRSWTRTPATRHTPTT